MAATLISCVAFVPLAVKWPLHTRRVRLITIKALVTSNIIQSVCLVGKGRLKERCGLDLIIYAIKLISELQDVKKIS